MKLFTVVESVESDIPSLPSMAICEKGGYSLLCHVAISTVFVILRTCWIVARIHAGNCEMKMMNTVIVHAVFMHVMLCLSLAESGSESKKRSSCLGYLDSKSLTVSWKVYTEI